MIGGLAMSGGSDTNPMPRSLKIEGAVQVIVGLVTAVILLAGAVGLLRRRKSARGWLLTYVIASLLSVPMYLIAMKITGPDRDAFQRRQWSEQIDAMERDGQKAPEFFKEMAAGKSDPTKWIVPLCLGLGCIFPLLLGITVVRKREEMARWA
jgi:hypothetical protein